MIENLLKYQETDAKLREIELELSANEDRRKALGAKKYLEGVEELLAKLDMRASELCAQFERATKKKAELSEQRVEFEGALDTVEDEGQAEYLLKRIDDLIAQIKALGDDAKKMSEEINAILAEYAQIKAKTKAAQVQYKECYEKYTAAKSEKQGDIDALKAELDKIAGTVSGELLEKYQKKRKEKLFPIVVELQSGSYCGGCYTEIFAHDLHRLDKGEIIEHVCGRLVYKK